MGYRTIEEYAASAEDALNHGTHFTYFDVLSGEERTGCDDPASRRFVVLNTGNEIVSHYLCPERYIRRLPYNNYEG